MHADESEGATSLNELSPLVAIIVTFKQLLRVMTRIHRLGWSLSSFRAHAPGPIFPRGVPIMNSITN